MVQYNASDGISYDQTTGLINNPYEAGDSQAVTQQINPYAKPVQNLQDQAKEPEANPYAQAAAKKVEQSQEEEILKREHWVVKSVTELSRIFMMDVTSKGVIKI